MLSLIADGIWRASSLGRNEWKNLIGKQGSLQPNCNKEGFNAVGTSSDNSKARIGYIANEQNDCASCDSRIGFGTGGHPNNSNTCGNAALHSSDNGDRDIKAIFLYIIYIIYIIIKGYILVQ